MKFDRIIFFLYNANLILAKNGIILFLEIVRYVTLGNHIEIIPK